MLTQRYKQRTWTSEMQNTEQHAHNTGTQHRHKTQAEQKSGLTCSFFVGMVVFLGMRVVMTPPAVSIPMDNGATSSSNRSCTLESPWPVKIAACNMACIHQCFVAESPAGPQQHICLADEQQYQLATHSLNAGQLTALLAALLLKQDKVRL